MSKVKDKVWIFTFEYAGIVKVGGLGEVPANQAKHLSNDYLFPLMVSLIILGKNMIGKNYLLIVRGK